MVTWKSMLSVFFAAFVIVEIIMLGIALLSIEAALQIVIFFYAIDGALIPTLMFWLFLMIGLLVLIISLITGYLQIKAGYALAVIASIMIALVFASTEYMAIFIGII